MPTVSEAIFHEVAEQLAPMTTTWQTILREHGRTPAGHCAGPTCGRPGYGTPDWQVHPCGVRALAELARARHGSTAEQGADQSRGGSPNDSNRSGPKVVISRMRPASTASTSSLNGRKIVSPGRHR